MELDFYAYTNQGERPVNEDSVGMVESGGIYAFALCDGLGGHGNGDQASRAAVDAMLNTVKASPDSDDLLSLCLNNANRAVIDVQQSTQKSMRTTATFLYIKQGRATWGHIGDSRIYRFHKSKFVQRTPDHSVVQTLVDTGEIKESEMRHHPDRSLLLRCIPFEEDKGFTVDSKDYCLSPGDCFLMMSDGFWDWIDEKMMKKVLRSSKSAKAAVESFTEKAFKYGTGNNMDNLSIIVIKVK